MKVYLVQGSAGEYADRSEWFVAAYTDEASAQKHAKAAASAWEKLRDTGFEGLNELRSNVKMQQKRGEILPLFKYDPDVRLEKWDDTTYKVVTVPFFPSFEEGVAGLEAYLAERVEKIRTRF